MLNGPGIRNVLFVAGCNHVCKGCYNKSTWNPNSGFKFT
ncbi:UNVERIFIED_CONTAM: 4Fe-4S cluster-binding domain-containing protein, partial [Kocuria sp. CPCC 205274]